MEKITSPRFDFKGWNLKEFAKGRKKLAVTLIGAILTFVVTNKPELAVAMGAAAELLYAILDYYVKEK